jgi:hypothetical protein
MIMRKRFEPQMALGATPIEQIVFNAKSRDDIPQILRGLQHVWSAPKVRDQILEILEGELSREVNFNTGRPGMNLWVLLVLGTLRVGLNIDYDRLQELVNEHKTIRAMLGHASWGDDFEYQLQTLKDNVALLTPEILDKINTQVVDEGHKLVKKKMKFSKAAAILS